MRGIFYSVLSLCLVGLAACGTSAIPTPEPTEAASDTLRVAMLADVGGLDDASFNALTFAGVSAVTGRLGLEFAVEEATSSAEYDVGIRAFAEAGHNIIVTVGVQMSEPTRTIAADYPDIHFIGIDQFQDETMPNVTGIIFAEDQAGYLAGVLAANLTETDTIGGVYGPQVVQPVAAFAAGYENGAQSVNPDITVLTEFHPGSVDVGFTDVDWGSETADAHMDAGADVVFAAAGETGNGALVAVANRANEQDNIFCIGVDTDQWLTVPEARPCLVTSAVKNIPQAVDEVVEQIVNGSPPSGNYTGPVGLASFHDFTDDIPNELQTELDRVQAGLLDDSIDTGFNP